MRLPRNLSGVELIQKLARLGYKPTRQTGSHVRLSCSEPSQHHITVPQHEALRIGTLSAIVADVAAHKKLTREELIARISK